MRKLLRKIAAGGDGARFYQASLDALTEQPILGPVAVDVPWSVAFHYDAPNRPDRMNRLGGGGVLISDRWILTCAHLFSDIGRKRDEPPLAEKNFYAHIGGQHLHSGTVRRISTPLAGPFRPLQPGKHPAAVGDICLVELAEPVDETPLRVAATPAQVGEQVRTFGWPKGNDGTGSLSQLDTAIVDPRGGMRLWPGPGELCAAVPKGLLLGPGFSGQPVVRHADTTGANTPEVVALISRGKADKLPFEFPMVLTDITAHLAWITTTTAGAVTPC
ncbi:trypsin-like serine protease [Amycolatopsis thailandensis]|uniref:trypsin-like serine protease n=1 Tax=Amycolatopsis thailandensis TaxID=589330 RepID=UPI00362BA649